MQHLDELYRLGSVLQDADRQLTEVSNALHMDAKHRDSAAWLSKTLGALEDAIIDLGAACRHLQDENNSNH